MSGFVNPLRMTALTDAVTGYPLRNRDGKQLYRVDDPGLSFNSEIAGMVITVEAKFVTDLASIPRLPLVYLLLNECANIPGVIHDFLYSKEVFPRLKCDQILREACLAIGVSSWKAWLIYTGVRIGGASHYGSK